MSSNQESNLSDRASDPDPLPQTNRTMRLVPRAETKRGVTAPSQLRFGESLHADFSNYNRVTAVGSASGSVVEIATEIARISGRDTENLTAFSSGDWRAFHGFVADDDFSVVINASLQRGRVSVDIAASKIEIPETLEYLREILGMAPVSLTVITRGFRRQ